MIPAANNSQIVTGRKSRIGPSSCPSKYATTHTPLAPARTASRRSSVGFDLQQESGNYDRAQCPKRPELERGYPSYGQDGSKPGQRRAKIARIWRVVESAYREPGYRGNSERDRDYSYVILLPMGHARSSSIGLERSRRTGCGGRRRSGLRRSALLGHPALLYRPEAL